MKYLIAYYSNTGNNENLALAFKNKADCEIIKINEKKKRTIFTIFFDLLFNRKPKLSDYNVDVSKYDAVILIAPIWIGRIASPMQSFITKEKDNIKKYAYLTLCGGVNGQKEKIEKSLFDITKRYPILIKEFTINNFLPEDKTKKSDAAISYRVTTGDLNKINNEIDSIMEKINNL